jgi:hypothetical protein
MTQTARITSFMYLCSGCGVSIGLGVLWGIGPHLPVLLILIRKNRQKTFLL